MLVIDAGSIIGLIFWIIVIVVVIGVIIWFIGAIAEGASDLAESVKAVGKPSKNQSEIERMLSSMGLNKQGHISSDIDRDEFKDKVKAYNVKLKELLDQDNEKAAERLAKNFYASTQFDIYLSIICDYKHAYPESYNKVLGKSNFKVNYSGESYFKVGTTKIVNVKSANQSGWSGQEEYVRNVEIYSAKTKVLDVTLTSNTGIYDTPSYSFFTVFKPGEWIIDVLEFGESLYVQIPITEKERANKNAREKLLS